jgi:hypothetical protein
MTDEKPALAEEITDYYREALLRPRRMILLGELGLLIPEIAPNLSEICSIPLEFCQLLLLALAATVIPTMSAPHISNSHELFSGNRSALARELLCRRIPLSRYHRILQNGFLNLWIRLFY